MSATVSIKFAESKLRNQRKYIGTYGTLKSARTQATLAQKRLAKTGEKWFAEITEHDGVAALASVWRVYLYPNSAALAATSERDKP